MWQISFSNMVLGCIDSTKYEFLGMFQKCSRQLFLEHPRTTAFENWEKPDMGRNLATKLK